MECEHCHSVHLGMANLRRHFKMRHSDEAPRHRCTYCPAVFRKKYSLDVHLRTHTAETPYSCAKCSSQFKRLHHLRAHALVCEAMAARKRRRADRSTLETVVEFTLIEDTVPVMLPSSARAILSHGTWRALADREDTGSDCPDWWG